MEYKGDRFAALVLALAAAHSARGKAEPWPAVAGRVPRASSWVGGDVPTARAGSLGA